MQSSAPFRPSTSPRSAADSPAPAPDRCPFLGGASESTAPLPFPSEANNCFRSRFPVPLSTIHQESYCLSEEHVSCPVYQQYAQKQETSAAGLAAGAAVVAPVVPGRAPMDARPEGAGGVAVAPALVVGAAMAAAAPALQPTAPLSPAALPRSAAPLPPASAAPIAPPLDAPVFPVDGPLFPVYAEEPVFPDFQPDFGPEPEPQPERRTGVGGRTVIIGLLLLALLVLAGWAWLNFLANRGPDQSASGVIVSLPTLAATADLSTVQAGIAVGAAAEQTATALAVPLVGGLLATPTAALAAGSDEGATTGGEGGATTVGEGGGAGEPAATDVSAATAQAELDSIAATATALFAGAVVPTQCAAPDWWVVYVVQEGDTLASLATPRGILAEELIVANCLAAPELTPGQQLYLPPVGVIVLLPGLATPTAAATATATRPSGFPTRRPVLFPTPTFPVVIILPTREPPQPEATDAPTRDAAEPPTRVPPTATQSSQRPTATPPVFATATAPNPNATATPPLPATVPPTRTPPGSLNTPTPTRAATQTPPVP